MQAGRVVSLALELETDGTCARQALDHQLARGLAPQVGALARRIALALARRERRAADRTCAQIQPRCPRGRFC